MMSLFGGIFGGVFGKSSLDDYETLYEYIVTDQKKEGKELGKIKAAKIYEPILKKMKQELLDLKKDLSEETEDFDSQYKLLRKKAEYFIQQKDIVLRDIEVLKKGHPGKAELIDNFLITRDLNTGIVSTTDGIISVFLDDIMGKKRKKHCKKEFKKMVEKYKIKVDEVKAEIKQIIINLKALKEEDKQKLEIIATKVNGIVSDYEAALENYNYLKNLL